MSPPDGTPTTKPWRRKGDGLLPLRTHLKGYLSINLVLVIILPLDGENFLVHKEDIFMPILSMLLEETLCSCLSDFLQSRSKEVSL